jgi:septal ring factor EnvC (AmiA/AmiB activator)
MKPIHTERLAKFTTKLVKELEQLDNWISDSRRENLAKFEARMWDLHRDHAQLTNDLVEMNKRCEELERQNAALERNNQRILENDEEEKKLRKKERVFAEGRWNEVEELGIRGDGNRRKYTAGGTRHDRFSSRPPVRPKPQAK